MAAWIKQLPAQVKKHGPEKASWYCVWDEPDGTRRCKSCGPGKTGKKLAQELADRTNAAIKLGVYQDDRPDSTLWREFRKKYQDVGLAGVETSSVVEALRSLDHLARILKLDGRPMSYVTTERIAEFVAKRRSEPGKKPGSTVSPATVNKDLRHIKAALRTAEEWKYLATVPRIRFEREPQRLPQFITPEHFSAIYSACDGATMPGNCPGGSAAWWRGLLVFSQMTGWRISEILALRWSDVDLQASQAVTRAADNKGKRDEVTPLHPLVVEHLEPLRSFFPEVFHWDHHRRTLDSEFARIQDAAGINLACRVTGRVRGSLPGTADDHECTDACHRYGFHDGRRAFATLNAPNMTREALQSLMRHQSPLTTARYINMARQLNPAVQALHVPALKPGDVG